MTTAKLTTLFRVGLFLTFSIAIAVGDTNTNNGNYPDEINERLAKDDAVFWKRFLLKEDAYSLLPTRAPIPAGQVDCVPFIGEVAALGNVVDRAANTLTLAGDLLMNLNCAALVADVEVENFTTEVCDEVKRRTIAALGDGGLCAIALASYTGDGTEVTLQSVFKEKGKGNRNLQSCGGNEAGCNDLLTCQFLSAVCSPIEGEIVEVVAVAAAGIVVNYFRASLLAYVLTAAISIGTGPTALIVAGLALAYDIIVAEGQGLYCENALNDCVSDGTAAGFDCQGAACCPDETATECGINCCCCGIGFAPRGPSCQCVPA